MSIPCATSLFKPDLDHRWFVRFATGHRRDRTAASSRTSRRNPIPSRRSGCAHSSCQDDPTVRHAPAPSSCLVCPCGRGRRRRGKRARFSCLLRRTDTSTDHGRRRYHEPVDAKQRHQPMRPLRWNIPPRSRSTPFLTACTRRLHVQSQRNRQNNSLGYRSFK